MANTLTNVIPQLLAQGLMALREACVMPRLVNNDFSSMAAEKGTTIDVPIPSAITAQSVSPSNTPPSTADTSPTKVQIPLDQWYEAPFYLTDKEVLEAMDGYIPMQASEAVKALGNQVNSNILSKYTGVYGYQGTAATTPFATDTSDATGVRKILNKQLAPVGDRRCVLDPDAEANALNLRAFQDANFGAIPGSPEMAMKMGFSWYMDQLIPTHTTAAVGTILTDQADIAIGDTSVHCDGVTTAIGVGDVFTVAGDTQTYTCLTVGALATNDQDITSFAPAAKVAWADSAAMTFKASHVVNLAFHRDAFAFATRPLEDTVVQGLGSIIQSAVDPVSGLTLRLEVSREHKRIRWSYDILWGAALVRAELATRLAG